MESSAPADPSHDLSEKKTDTSENKVATATSILTDPKFPLPTLTANSSPLAYAKSFAVLSCLLASGLSFAWFIDMPLVTAVGIDPVLLLAGAFVFFMALLFATGTVWIDWWELVLGYWWLSMPIGAAAGLALVMNQENTTQMGEVD